MTELIVRAWKARTTIPAFNIPYLPIMEPVVGALRDTRCFGLISVARLEWIKFQAGGPEAIYEKYQRVKDERFTRLHLDHVPVISEDGLRIDYEADLSTALELGYDSVMVDGSRLPLAENIAATKKIVDMAHSKGVPVEAELGAVMRFGAGPLPSYEELFSSGEGFTDPDEARRFVAETGTDWLSVAVGNIHGAITAERFKKKIQTRLSIERIDTLNRTLGIPLVLHGGTGIRKKDLLSSFRRGIAKVNIGAAIRRPYEALAESSITDAQHAVYETTTALIREEMELADSVDVINPATECLEKPGCHKEP